MSFRAIIFFIVSIVAILGIFFLFPETFNVNNPQAEINLFLSNPAKHWWSGFIMFSFLSAGIMYFIANRGQTPSFFLFWFLISFIMVFVVALGITDAGVAAHQQFSDGFWTLINEGDPMPMVGFLVIPVVIYSMIMAYPIYAMLVNSASTAAGLPKVMPEGEEKKASKHRRHKQSSSQQKMAKKLGRQ